MGELYEVVVFTASLRKVCPFDLNYYHYHYHHYHHHHLVDPASVNQYADPVLDQLDTHQVVAHRLFRESCFSHKGNYVKVGDFSPSNGLTTQYSAGFVSTRETHLRYHNIGQLNSVLPIPST